MYVWCPYMSIKRTFIGSSDAFTPAVRSAIVACETRVVYVAQAAGGARHQGARGAWVSTASAPKPSACSAWVAGSVGFERFLAEVSVACKHDLVTACTPSALPRASPGASRSAPTVDKGVGHAGILRCPAAGERLGPAHERGRP